MPQRMLSYNVLLHEKHNLPVISMVMYPFHTSIPESPYRVISGQQEILTFHFRVLPLWKLDAQQCIKEHAIPMYPLLPTMHGANGSLLIEAIKEMAMQYNGEKLSRRLVWFRTLLHRVETLSSVDKSTVEEHLHMFDELLDNDPYILKREELAATRAATQAEVKALQAAVINVVEARFSTLITFAEEKVSQISKPDLLHTLIKQVGAAPDEATARWALNTIAA